MPQVGIDSVANFITDSIAGGAGITVEEDCLGGEYCSRSEECEGKVELDSILDNDVGEDNIFFIETSPKEVITPREACSLESAARNSGLHVIMVRAAKVLDKADNTTCQMLNRYSLRVMKTIGNLTLNYPRFKGAISVYHIDPAKFAEKTPLEGFFTSAKLAESMSKYGLVHGSQNC